MLSIIMTTFMYACFLIVPIFDYNKLTLFKIFKSVKTQYCICTEHFSVNVCSRTSY